MDKPRLSFWQIWNMSFGFLGIQFGWGLQMANMSAIYQYLGARENEIPILWLAAPLTGLIVQPIIGYFSDRTWNRLGRRRPYFLGGAIAASLALVAMPNSSALWMAAGLLWILDASVNVSMEPFRAFVGDMLPHDQRKSGFAMQSLLIGAGAVLSSALPYILTRGFGISGESTVESAIPPDRPRGVHDRGLRLLPRRAVHGSHHARVPARGPRGVREGEARDRRPVSRLPRDLPGHRLHARAHEEAGGRAVLHVVRAVLPVDLLRARCREAHLRRRASRRLERDRGPGARRLRRTRPSSTRRRAPRAPTRTSSGGWWRACRRRSTGAGPWTA